MAHGKHRSRSSRYGINLDEPDESDGYVTKSPSLCSQASTVAPSPSMSKARLNSAPTAGELHKAYRKLQLAAQSTRAATWSETAGYGGPLDHGYGRNQSPIELLWHGLEQPSNHVRYIAPLAQAPGSPEADGSSQCSTPTQATHRKVGHLGSTSRSQKRVIFTKQYEKIPMDIVPPAPLYESDKVVFRPRSTVVHGSGQVAGFADRGRVGHQT